MWPSHYYSRRLLERAVFEAFPGLAIAGRLVFALEISGYTLTYDVAVARSPAIRASWMARWLHGASDRPASVSLGDEELMTQGDPLVESLYRAAGVDPASLGQAALAYGPDALAIVEREAADDETTQVTVDKD